MAVEVRQRRIHKPETDIASITAKPHEFTRNGNNVYLLTFDVSLTVKRTETELFGHLERLFGDRLASALITVYFVYPRSEDRRYRVVTCRLVRNLEVLYDVLTEHSLAGK